MKNNNFNLVYFFEALFLVTVMIFIGFRFIQQSNSSAIFSYSLQTTSEFKILTDDYLRTDLQNINFKKYFDNEAEQMIQNQKNTYSFLETCLTAAINEKNPARKKFYFDWAWNVFKSIPTAYQNTPALSIIHAKLIYFQNTQTPYSTDEAEILIKLKSIPESHNLYSQSLVWMTRLKLLDRNLNHNHNYWHDLINNSKFKYKSLFEKCVINSRDLGCL